MHHKYFHLYLEVKQQRQVQYLLVPLIDYGWIKTKSYILSWGDGTSSPLITASSSS
jgi:hypothetical protein